MSGMVLLAWRLPVGNRADQSVDFRRPALMLYCPISFVAFGEWPNETATPLVLDCDFFDPPQGLTFKSAAPQRVAVLAPTHIVHPTPSTGVVHFFAPINGTRPATSHSTPPAPALSPRAYNVTPTSRIASVSTVALLATPMRIGSMPVVTSARGAMPPGVALSQ